MLSSLISGGLSALGSLGSSALSGHYSMALNKKMMDFQHDEADISRRWQEKMANSNYQRTVEDLRKANLNPLLAVGAHPDAVSASPQASGFSAISPDTSGVASAGSALGEAAKEALRDRSKKEKAEAKTAEATTDAVEAGIEKTKADTLKTKVDTLIHSLGAVAMPAATAYAGKKASEAVKVLQKAGINNAASIVKDVSPKASAAINSSKSLYPVMSGLLSLGAYGAGAGGSLYLGKKSIDLDKKLRKKLPDYKHSVINPLHIGH